jgi:hypothetical protein
MGIYIIHATMVLLTFGPPHGKHLRSFFSQQRNHHDLHRVLLAR